MRRSIATALRIASAKTDRKRQAIQLYVDERMTIPEVAATLGCGTSTIARWLKTAKATRPMGEAFALAMQKGRKKWGRRSQSIPWQSVKTGRWEFADSRWEAVRMQQLDNDPLVKDWTHVVERIPYVDGSGKRRFYAPDFFVVYVDGRQSVEEVKPKRFIASEPTLRKGAAARVWLTERGIGYKIITEDDIGIAAIASFKLDGLHSITDEERRLAYNRRKCAEIKRRNAPRVNATRAIRMERAGRIAAVYLSGKSLDETSTEFGLSVRTIVWWLDKLGIARRPAVMRPAARLEQSARLARNREKWQATRQGGAA